jgi:hypothetical protein
MLPLFLLPLHPCLFSPSLMMHCLWYHPLPLPPLQCTGVYATHIRGGCEGGVQDD